MNYSKEKIISTFHKISCAFVANPILGRLKDLSHNWVEFST